MLSAQQCGAGYCYSQDTPQHHMGEQHSLCLTCTAMGCVNIDLSIYFGSGQDMSCVV